MNDITLEDVINVLGEPRKKIGGEYVWQCKYCCDRGCDNFHYNERKQIAWCFADEEHSKKIYAEIMAKRDNNKSITVVAEPEWKPKVRYWYEANLENLYCYIVEANNNLLHNKQYLKYIKKKHNLDANTINDFLIGIDFNIDHEGLHIDKEITDAFVFPIFSKNGLVGCELRSIEAKVIRRTKDAPKCAAFFYDTKDAETLYVVEGLKDAYNLCQFLGKEEDYTVICGSNGVSTTLQALEDIDLKQYKRVALILDNDKAGDDMTKEVLAKYPNIVDCRDMIKPHKDITEYIMARG